MAHTTLNAQARPADTTAASIYTPGAGIKGIVHNIIICNTTSTDATYTIYHDLDGTTYDADSEIFKGTCLADDFVLIEAKVTLKDQEGNIAVKQGTSSALNFTLHGEEIS